MPRLFVPSSFSTANLAVITMVLEDIEDFKSYLGVEFGVDEP